MMVQHPFQCPTYTLIFFIHNKISPTITHNNIPLQVQEQHFGPTGDLEVRCRATVSAVYQEGGTPEAMPVVLEQRDDLIRGEDSCCSCHDK